MTPDESVTHVSPELVSILARAHPNVLLIGSPLATARVVDRIRIYLLLPIDTWSPPDARVLPDKRSGTLLIPAIDMADDRQQSQLRAWLEARVGPMQVLAQSATPLFSLVERGVFDTRLYYQLNQLYVDLTRAQEN